MLVVCVFFSAPKISAQELDDVEADMDTAISESDAAQSAEEYGRKREAEEKTKLGAAKVEAEKTSAKAAQVKEASTKRLAVLEQQTAKSVAERKVFETQTKKAQAQIQKYESEVKAAEEKLAQAKAESQAASNALKNAQTTIEERKKHLAEVEANRKKEVAARTAATRKLASIAGSLPGKTIVMAKDCALHGSLDLKSPQTRFLKKGMKVELAKLNGEGWFHARSPTGKGFMHKTCK